MYSDKKGEHTPVMMNTPSLRRQSPFEAYSENRKKGRAIESPSPNFVQDPTPTFFGAFIRSCGSSYKLEDVGSSSSAASTAGAGCFVIRIGGGNTPNKKADEDDDPTALIANAMTNMSLQERDLAYEDLHGVSAAVHETPELIAQALHEMEVGLQKINHKPAYDMAISIRPEYVRDPKFRLMFLRADRFDAELAAKRLVNLLDWKLKIFGKEKLCQWHIGLDDLDDDARFMVESGLCQVLPERDSRGRVISITSASYLPQFYRNADSFLQMTYYFCMSVAEDETNQISGMVSVCYGLTHDEAETKKISQNQYSTWDSTLLTFCIPLRIEAVHFCALPSGMHFSLNWVFKAAGVFHRARFRAHFGSHLECEYALLSFGVPSHLLPFTTESELKPANHKKWVHRRIIKEQELKHGKAFSGIELPRPNDVLLGKGKPIQNHPGNRRLLELAELYLNEYDQANPNGSRMDVARKIVQEVLHPGSSSGSGSNACSLVVATDGNSRGRFLQRREDKLESGWWEEINDEKVLLAKVSHSLRGIRKRNNIVAKRSTK